MRKRLGLFVFALALACGNLGTGGDNNGGSGGTGGGGSGGTGGAGGGGAGGTGGSGGGAGGVPDYVSGTRIKARVQSTPDGAKAFAGFYDSTLATPCTFNRAADDAVRCLPANVAYTGTYWGDSGCTTLIAYSTTGCAATWASKYETTASCVDTGVYTSSARTHVYSIAGAYSGSMVWVGSPASCTMTTPPAGWAFFTLGSEVPASTFSAGSVDIAP